MLAYMKGVRVYNDAFVKNIDKEKVIEILARRAGVEVETVRNSNPAGLDPNQDINRESFDEIQKFFVDQGLMSAAVPLDDLIDPSFAAAAIAKIGRYK